MKLGKMSLIRSYSVTHKLNTNFINADNLLAAYVYVGFRSHGPDETTVKEELEGLQENNIDVSQLVE